MSATKRLVARKKYVDLVWSGAASSNVDIYRNNTLVVTTPNDGTHTDTIGGKVTTFTYKVCEAGTTVCSGNVTVTF